MAGPTGSVPIAVRLATYGVGFGDCFLLSMDYAGDRHRHVLIDFGTIGRPENAPEDLMMQIAWDIERRCKEGNSDLHVVATHRHKDHISGFNTGAAKSKATGGIIAALAPRMVIQPWTEQATLARDAREPRRAASAARRMNLVQMQDFAHHAEEELDALSQRAAPLKAIEAHAAAARMAEDNVANPLAVENLRTMAPNQYLKFGDHFARKGSFPGVTVHVLGPPTVADDERIRKAYAKESDQYWPIMGASSTSLGAASRGAGALFDKQFIATGETPVDKRWFERRLYELRGQQLRSVVRILDKVINNTSLILLFDIAGLKLLFPGDAQLENWTYALERCKTDPKLRALLRDVDVYKVGHHGSRNATPVPLWEMFAHKKKKGAPKPSMPFSTVMSTDAEKFPPTSYEGEVPRESLVKALRSGSELLDTQTFGAGTIGRELTFKRSGKKWAQSSRDIPATKK